MCYSAQIQADYRKYVKTFGAHMDIEEFARLYFERADGSKAKIPKAVDDAYDRDENIVLEFRPNNGQLMHVACLWSRWSAPGQPDLLSFAAITDEPSSGDSRSRARPVHHPYQARKRGRVA